MSDPAAVRVRDWYRASKAAVCDLVEPWEHGTIVRCARYPTFYEYNLVRVEDEPDLDVQELIDFADGALAGLEHRRIDFEQVQAADARRNEFECRGWKAMRLLWMRHERPPPPGPEIAVATVPYDAVDHLRLAWHREDFPDHEFSDYQVAAREVSMTREVQVLAVDGEDGVPIAFAQLERHDGIAEITHVYVHPEHRGAGRGTAMTRAAILAAGEGELVIVADDEDRPKRLYERLGFRGVWRSMELLKLP